MNLDDVKTAWKCQDKADFARLERDQLQAFLKAQGTRHNRAQFWSAVFVVVVMTSFAAFMFVERSRMEIVWPVYAAVILLIGAAAYVAWGTRQRKKNEERKQFSDSLQDQLKSRSGQLNDQIRFSSWGMIWFYLLPIVAALCLFDLQSYLNGRRGIDAFQEGVLFSIVVGGFAAYGIGWLSTRATKKEKRKVDLELKALGCPPPDEKTPMMHCVARISLAVCALGLCGFLLVQLSTEAPRMGMPIQPAPGFDQLGSFGEQETRQIDAWLEEVRKAGDYPSLMVAIVGDGRVLYQGAVGYADLESRREATPDTLWHVASVTKAFTCTLAAKLHEKGVIDLDRPVRDYLPEDVSISETPLRGAAITLRQLAAHTSGLPKGQPGDVQSIEGRYALEPKRLYTQLGKVELLFEPGFDEAYSNLGMGLLGHALERAAGIPFDRLLEEEVLTPLGMTRSGISIADEDRDLSATGYGRQSPRESRRHSFSYRLAPSGGLITSVAELSQFLLAQMPEKSQPDALLTGPMLMNLHTPVELRDGSEVDRALGWSVRERDSIGRILKKNGGRVNASAWIGFTPDHGVGVAVMANCGDASVDEIGYWLLERAAPNADPDEFDRDPRFAKVAPFTGVRWDSDTDDQPTVRVRGKWLRLMAVDGIPVDRLMKTARENFGDKARMRFAEDLVEVLAAAGHSSGWTVTLMLDRDDGKGPVAFEEEMTEEKRDAASGNK